MRKKSDHYGYALIISDRIDGQDGVQTAHNNVYFEPIEDITPTTIRTSSFVLPISDAKIFNSQDGAVYAYNVSMPYLEEIKHLAEVEKNIVIGQAFLYQGRNLPTGKPNAFQWVMMIGIILLAALAIFA